MIPRFRIAVGAALVALALGVAGPAAAAEPSVDAQLFRPSIFGGNFLAIEDAHTLDERCYGFGLYANYANSLLEQRVDDKFNSGILESIASVNLTLAASLWDWMSLGVDVPFHVRAHGKSRDEMESETVFVAPLEDRSAFGDVKGEIKFGLLAETNSGLGLALSGFGFFPTGDPDLFLGDGTFGGGGLLILEKDLGFLNVAAEGGYLYRSEREVLNTNLGGAILYGAGVSRTIAGGLSFSLEYSGRAMQADSGGDIRGNPMEITGTLRYRFDGGFRVLGGGGGGLGGGLGSPAYRTFAGFDYYPHCEYPTQGKLVVAVVGAEGEPLDATLSVTGPVSFSLATGPSGQYMAMMGPGSYQIDAQAPDRIPAGATVEIEVGKESSVVITLQPIPVPKPATLAVKILAAKNGFPLSGAQIQIRNTETSETKKAASVQGLWTGELTPGTYHVVAGMEGFAEAETDIKIEPEQDHFVTLKLPKKFVPVGHILFFFSSPRIRPLSDPVLKQVLDVIHEEQKTGGFKRLRVEGHTSTEGWEGYNQMLSERRAEAVRMWLAAHGVDPKLMVTRGFGATRPIVEEHGNELERQKNRRVEFVFEYEDNGTPAP